MEIKDNNNTNSILIGSIQTWLIISGIMWWRVRNGVTKHNKIYVDGVEVADLYVDTAG